jgi:hypothetical protein
MGEVHPDNPEGSIFEASKADVGFHIMPKRQVGFAKSPENDRNRLATARKGRPMGNRD